MIRLRALPLWAAGIVTFTVLIDLLANHGSAQQECWPSQEMITNTIRNIEVIRVESERQTELLKELRAAARGKKP